MIRKTTTPTATAVIIRKFSPHQLRTLALNVMNSSGFLDSFLFIFLFTKTGSPILAFGGHCPPYSTVHGVFEHWSAEQILKSMAPCIFDFSHHSSIFLFAASYWPVMLFASLSIAPPARFTKAQITSKGKCSSMERSKVTTKRAGNSSSATQSI